MAAPHRSGRSTHWRAAQRWVRRERMVVGGVLLADMARRRGGRDSVRQRGRIGRPERAAFGVAWRSERAVDRRKYPSIVDMDVVEMGSG